MPTLKDVLDRSGLTTAQKADVWDRVTQAQSPTALQQQLDQLALPRTLKADLWDARLAPAAEATAPDDAPGGLWESAKKGGAALLEAAGRPGELVAGTVAGALAPQRDLTRGVRAFFEPLVGGTQQETFGKVLEEQGLLQDRPWVRAGVGFAADVVTDPLNLLGGAGIVRRGLLKGATKAGISEKTAKTALGVPIGEYVQSTVVPQARQTLYRAAEKSPLLQKFIPDPQLAQVIEEGVSARDVKNFAAGERRAILDAAKGQLATIRATHNLTDDDLVTLSRAIKKPNSAEAATVAADPARLGAAKGEYQAFFDRLRNAEIEAGVMQAERPFTELPAKMRAALEALDNAQYQTLMESFRTGTPIQDPTLSALAKNLERIAAKGEVDLRTLSFETDPVTKELIPTVSTRRTDYVPQLSQRQPDALLTAALAAGPRGTLKAAKEKVLTWDEAVANGMTENLQELALARAADSARARASSSFLTDVKIKFGAPQPAAGFRQLKPDTLKAMPQPLQEFFDNGAVYLPKAVADEIEKVQVRFRSPEFAEGVLGRSLRLWKTYATAFNLPGHQLVNFAGNAGNMYAAGMGPDQISRYYVTAGRALHSKKAPAGWTDIVDEMRQRNLLGEATGLAGDIQRPDQLSGAAKAMMSGELNPLNPDNRYYTGLRNINQRYIEEPAKVALYKWAKDQGQSADQAALTVKKYLFDYSELSDFEKQYLRNVFPFYTWTRKNVPLQLATLLQNPTRLTNQKRVFETFTSMATADESDPIRQAELPTYMQSPEFFRAPGVTTAEGEPVTLASRMPLFDLNLLTADPRTLLERGGFMLNPMLRVPAELMMGRRLGSQVPIESTRQVDPSALQRLTGLGVDESGRTSALARYLSEQVPLPLGAVARTTAAGFDEKADIPFGQELGLRAMGMTPVPITSEVLRQAAAARRRTQRARDED